ncbi:hypothetical protein [Limnoraphis robusta]|uniref:Uncharacterized protein n=1 Tax=Limnoraphis robusta CCNP1315 TaxID=3110306 RepID=A0ABU5TX29_9CYAN|nr:hypothetical protein [Limnoraphis robusta]MEA5519364.1 hypothetical protein [Limnoraphis robusta CCNP1315]MEA5545112.1 hypothetical protein [Limnoraphis robusta CCNP1324]
MQLVKLITASLLIPIGLFCLLTIATGLINPDASVHSKVSIAIGGLILGLPALGIGGWLLWDSSYQSRQKIENRSRRIHSIFFHLLVQNQGKITPSDLVRFTHLSPQEAEKFILSKAIELQGTWEKTPEGETIYYFELK